MNKILQGYEIYKLIAFNKIPKGSTFIDEKKQLWTFDGEELVAEKEDYMDLEFAKMNFKEILNEDEIRIYRTLRSKDTNIRVKNLERFISQYTYGRSLNMPDGWIRTHELLEFLEKDRE